ncbi:MAG: beta-ketoacyl-ACP synthase III [Microbacteriaceae bacterium]
MNSAVKTLKQNEPQRYSRIYSYGQARGELAVSNDEIAGPIESSDEWIRQRTGIITRARASADVKIIDLAVAASLDAIAKAGIDASQIDTVIVGTISNEVQTPSLAALLAERIGSNPAAAYDISAACAGFAYGIAQADALVKSGTAQYVLVLGAEKLSEIIDPKDRSISFLLGDGAGAAVVGPSDIPGISPTLWGSDGSKWSTIGMTNTFHEYRDNPTEIPWPTLHQDGRVVFRWAVWEMAKVAKKTLEAAGIEAKDLAAFIPHQANMRIIDEFAKQLELPDSVVIARDIETTGNTSAASIPLAAARLLDEHPELSGGLALQIGFGAGLVYGAQVVVLP